MISSIVKLIRTFFGSNKKSLNDEARLRMQKNFVNKNSEDHIPEDFIDSKMQSMKDSQGPENMARETRNSNMGQRNY